MSYIKEAFEKICSEAVKTGSFYVCLVESIPFYGGPEEGGWWGTDTIVIAYQEFGTLEVAELTKNKIEILAKELQTDMLRAYCKYCLNTMEWLEARGLDADYLPELDGPSKFRVVVSESIPVNSFGSRHYE